MTLMLASAFFKDWPTRARPRVEGTSISAWRAYWSRPRHRAEVRPARVVLVAVERRLVRHLDWAGKELRGQIDQAIHLRRPAGQVDRAHKIFPERRSLQVFQDESRKFPPGRACMIVLSAER